MVFYFPLEYLFSAISCMIILECQVLEFYISGPMSYVALKLQESKAHKPKLKPYFETFPSKCTI